MVIKLVSIARRSDVDSPMQEVFSAEVSLEDGIQGDSKGKPGPRQLTILSKESWIKACHDLDVDLPWTARRANLLIQGFEFLPTDVGRTIQIGEIILEITRETAPCWKMDKVHQGLKESLMSSWRGGVCCKVLQAGTITTGDNIDLIKDLF
ncbi:MAG: MOSC domain-containing protein [Gammaproteobacteria bacterium]|nr:MOSC domain-containing protein [Gammaproteobacteria bacterium]